MWFSKFHYTVNLNKVHIAYGYVITRSEVRSEVRSAANLLWKGPQNFATSWVTRKLYL